MYNNEDSKVQSFEETSFEQEDLVFLEKDLTNKELVSILFLLHGRDKSQWILEKLADTSYKNHLFDFAVRHTNWKTQLIEVFVLTKNFTVINKLGIKSSEAREHFRKSARINVGLKLLYQLCETCSEDSSNKLIDHVKNHFEPAQNCNGNMLELFLLHAISGQLIKCAPLLDDCDFSFIINFFNNNKCEKVVKLLKEFPKRSNLLDNAKNNSFNTVNLSSPKEQKVSRPMIEYSSKHMQVLIINQQNFYRETNPELINMLPDHDLSERKGTGKDTEALKNLFDDFGYQIIVKNDLTHINILKEVEEATKNATLLDGLIVCVLSHGHEGIVYGKNSIPVRIKDIKRIIASKLLLGKSKILIIQACQGENLQKSVRKVSLKTEFDGPSQSTLISGSVFADFLTFWSTIEGFASVRHIDNGSWFIQELVKKIRELHQDQHFMDICTNVISEVSAKRGYRDECMLPKLETTFTKNFRFPETKKSSYC